MNICILSGRLKGNAVVRGSKDTKVLSFIVETVVPFNDGQKKDLVSCVLFKFTSELEKKLTKNGDGLWIEAEGRVSSSILKTNGEKRYNTDVIVRHWTFNIINREGEQ